MTNNNNQLTNNATGLSIEEKSQLRSLSLSQVASSRPELLHAALQRATLARTNNFDLLSDGGWEMLATDVAEDFAYLTLGDLSDTLKLGVKGKLDTYKNRPLNYTRVYQWVEGRARYSVGYWQHHYPEFMTWAGMAHVTDEVMGRLDKIESASGAGSSLGHLISEAITTKYYPFLRFPPVGIDPETLAQQQESYRKVKEVGFVTFAAQYPAFAAKHPNLF